MPRRSCTVKSATSLAWLPPPNQARRFTTDGILCWQLALKLSADDGVAGFGERFDHRDHCLDVVVLEQYESEGRHGHTYLPSDAFAHVVGANGTSCGFRMRTARRSWYDVAPPP